MPYLSDNILDNGLQHIINAGTDLRVDICHTAEPTTYIQATSTNSCGNKTALTPGAIGNSSSGTGRSVTIPAITDGSVTATNTAAYWAVSDVSGTELLATGTLTSSQSVTSGNTFTLDAIEIFLRDATAA